MRTAVSRLAQPAFSSELRALVSGRLPQEHEKFLVIGNLRSYGDEVLNVGGRYVQTTRCDRILDLDRASHTVTVECGVTVDSIQRRLAPLGYLLPVTPGTAYVTIGGAIANDVHGKNHHVAGTFGRYVQEFELARSSGEVLRCSPAENPDWFAATIGGMGLTGAITWARLQLRQVASPLLVVTSHRFHHLDEFFEIDARYQDSHEYTVAWIDCLAAGRTLGRGIYSVADHTTDSQTPARPNPATAPGPKVSVPITLPISPVNSWTLRLLNELYWRIHAEGTRQIDYRQWMYPLDSIGHWNRLYGPRGFRQFQCVVPRNQASAAVRSLLETISALGQGSFLAVLKNFGELQSPGWMSFPMPGCTLALDFANRGALTQDLLLELHRITAAAGGRLYAAKDGCSPAEGFERGYPNFDRFRRMIDPGIGSMLAQRLQLIG